jgi:CHAT domain-containing protein/tetratricopeptide (TPR) repeat protein
MVKDHLTGVSRGGRLSLEADAVIAEGFNLTDDLSTADSLYRLTLSGADAAGFRQLRASCLNGLGKIVEKRQRFVEAVGLYRSALEEHRILGGVEGAAAMLNNLGQVETSINDLENARRHLEESRDLALSCSAGWILGYVQYGLGAIAERLGSAERAVHHFRQSIGHHGSAGSTWGELGARLRLAYNLSTLGEYGEAVEHGRYCLERYERMKSLYGLSWTLSMLALAQHKLGNLVEAERYYRRAYEVRTGLGDRKGAAWCLNSLGMVCDLQGRYREALDFQNRAMDMYAELGDRGGMGDSHFGIGSVYFYLGDYDKSIEHYGEAFSMASEIGNDELRQKVASGMGSVYSAAGRMDLAEDFYRMCLGIARGSKRHADEIWSLNNLASFYIEAGMITAARDALSEAAGLLTEGSQDHIRSRTLHISSKVAPSTGEAILLAEQALGLAERCGQRELVWKCLSDLGELHLAMGDVSKGASLQDEAVRTVESLRLSVGSDELRRHMLRPAILPYERMVSLITSASGRAENALEAFGYTERARAQILAALLREAHRRIGDGGDDELGAEERNIISRITFLQTRLQDGSLTEDERGGLLGELKDLERRLVHLHVVMSEKEDRYAAALSPVNEDLDRLMTALDEGERMISYFLGRERSYLFSVTKKDVRVCFLPARSSIEEKVGYFLRVLRQSVAAAGGGASGGDGSTAAAFPAEVMHSAERELHRLLLGPIEDELQRGGRLVVVPDGLLHRLPFALLRNDGGYLIEEHEIYYAPSLWSLHYLRKRGQERRHVETGPIFDVIALGSSGVEASTAEGASRLYPFTEIPVEYLPNAAYEARAVAGLFPRSRTLTGPQAGERALKESPLERTRVLHIAAHCYIDNEDVTRSFIVLNPEAKRAGPAAEVAQDGLLQWHEIAGLELNAALVTLSACRSAGGVLAVGEGVTGLTQAFLHAGCDCVLASHLDVPDHYAHRFMLEFYQNVKKGLPAVRALRSTQLAAMGWEWGAVTPSGNAAGLRDGALESGGQPTASGSTPPVWAAFALIGDGSVSKGAAQGETETAIVLVVLPPLVLLLTLIILQLKSN